MRTVTFKSVLEGVATRLGLPAGELQSDQAAAIAVYLEDRVRDAWELYSWPWARVTEARVYRPRFSDVVPSELVVGDIVFHGDVYWAALIDAPGDVPSDASAQWEVATDFERYVLLAQPGKTRIALVDGVWASDPNLSKTVAGVDFSLSDGRIDFSPDAPAEVWVTFSLEHPRFTTAAWASGTAYVAGDVVFHGADCFVASVASSGQDPAAGSTYWTLQGFPHELARCTSLGAVADCLNESNQHDKGARMEKLAEERLLDELEKLLSKQQQTPRFAVRNK